MTDRVFIENLTVETVIGIGSCGALQPDIECGDIIVSGSSQAGEGLSVRLPVWLPATS